MQPKFQTRGEPLLHQPALSQWQVETRARPAGEAVLLYEPRACGTPGPACLASGPGPKPQEVMELDRCQTVAPPGGRFLKRSPEERPFIREVLAPSSQSAATPQAWLCPQPSIARQSPGRGPGASLGVGIAACRPPPPHPSPARAEAPARGARPRGLAGLPGAQRAFLLPLPKVVR